MELGKITKEIGIGAMLALLTVAALAHISQATLNSKTYGLALSMMEGTGSGAVYSAHQAAYSVAKPFLPLFGFGGSEAMLLIGYFLVVPAILLFVVAFLEYATLRMWKFGRLESASAVVLLSLGALSPAFYPGNFPPVVFGITFAVAGIFALVFSGYAKSAKMNAAFSYAGAIAAIALFSAGSWIAPQTVWVPLALLAAELVASRGKLEQLLTAPIDTLLRIAALVVPAFFAIGGGAFVFNLADIPLLLQFAPFATGFALLPILFIYWDKGHERAPEFSALAVFAFIASGSSPGTGAAIMLLPCAYGIRSFEGWKSHPPLLRVLLLSIPIVFAVFGLSGGAANTGSLAGAVLAAGAFATIAIIYDWENGAFARFGMAMILCTGAVMLSLQAQPFRSAGMGELAEYDFISAQIQDALVFIGKIGGEKTVAAYAPPSAIRLLSGAKPAFEKELDFAKYLASHKENQSMAASGAYVVMDAQAFDKTSLVLANASVDWTMRAYYPIQFTKDANNNDAGIYVGNDGSVIAMQLDRYGGLAPAPPRLLDGSGYVVEVLPLGQMALLMPGKPANFSGNLLVKPNKEYDSRLLEIYRNNEKYPITYQNGTVMIVRVG